MSTNLDHAPDGLTDAARETLAGLHEAIRTHQAGLAELDGRLAIPGMTAMFTATAAMMRRQLAVAQRELERCPDAFAAFCAGLSLGRLDTALDNARRALESTAQ